MKETEEILIRMGFKNPNDNVWKSEWFGIFILASTATPQELGEFIYNRGYNNGVKQLAVTPHSYKEPEPKQVEHRKSVLIRGSNIKDTEDAVKLLKKLDVDFYEIFSDEHEPVFIHTLSAYSYRGLKQIKIFAAMHGEKTQEINMYFDPDPNMLRCSTCGTKHMRGTMCHKCF